MCIRDRLNWVRLMWSTEFNPGLRHQNHEKTAGWKCRPENVCTRPRQLRYPWGFSVQQSKYQHCYNIERTNMLNKTHNSQEKNQVKKKSSVAETMFLAMFPGVATLGNICFGPQNLCPGSKNVFDSRQKHFFVFRAVKFVSATHVSRTAKLGNICIRKQCFLV